MSWLLMMLAVLVMRPSMASAQGNSYCQDSVQQWASRCAADEKMALSPRRCASGFATFRAEHEGAILDIELRAQPDGSFRSAGPHGISPIGEFADWSAAPSGLRTAFDKFAMCVERGVPSEVFGRQALLVGKRQSSGGSLPIPWRLIGAGIAIGFVLASFTKRMRPLRIASTVAPLVAFGGATWALRRFVFPTAFFHQNGHGAMWVDCALGGHCSYGPGFRELFGLAAQVDIARAEQGVFFAQSLLAATAPISAWVIARAAGAPRVIAWATAFVLAIEPGLGRLAQSESYFGVATWLLLGAAALLAGAARMGNSRSAVFAAAMSGAGLLIGQAVVVHPIAWVPAALVPLVVLVGRGSLRRRWRLFFVALLGTGFVALASSGPIVLRVYLEHRRWTGLFGRLVQEHLPAMLVVVAVILLAAASYPLRRHPGLRRWFARLHRHALPVTVFVVAFGLGAVLHPFLHLTPWIRHAWWMPYLPAAIAGLAAFATVVVPRRGMTLLGLGIAFLGLATAKESFRELTTLPTDALEARFSMRWREKLPEGAQIAFLERAEKGITTLPVFREPSRNLATIRLRPHEPSPAHELAKRPAAFYYRSSLCSTEAGRAFCESFERSLELEPIELAALPALPSMPQMPYDTDEVHVGLYRIKGTSSRASAEN